MGDKNDIQPIKTCTIIFSSETSGGRELRQETISQMELANASSPGKWPLKQIGYICRSVGPSGNFLV